MRSSHNSDLFRFSIEPETEMGKPQCRWSYDDGITTLSGRAEHYRHAQRVALREVRLDKRLRRKLARLAPSEPYDA